VRAYAVSLLDTATGKHYEARGTQIRLGCGPQCEIRVAGTPDLPVSRIHAELTIGAADGLVVRDAGSTHGTFLNGVRLTRPLPLRLGDKLMLGEGGPEFVLEGLGTSPQMPVARRMGNDIRRRVRGTAGLVLLVLLAGAVAYGVYWLRQR
jgi:FHA domain